VTTAIGVDPAAPRPEIAFRVHVPDQWLALDLDPATSDGWIEGVLDARIAEHPQAASQRGHLRRILQSLIEQQRAAGVFLAAVLAGTGPRATDLVGASLTLSWLRLDSPPDDIEWLARFLAEDAPADGEDPALRTVEIVDLPAGPAVRTTSSLLVPVPESSRHQRVTVNQITVPVPNTPWLAVLAVSSPNAELAEVFATLADEVAQSLAFPDPAEPAERTPRPAQRRTIGYLPPG
jgi:hypothetical protein